MIYCQPNKHTFGAADSVKYIHYLMLLDYFSASTIWGSVANTERPPSQLAGIFPAGKPHLNNMRKCWQLNTRLGGSLSGFIVTPAATYSLDNLWVSLIRRCVLLMSDCLFSACNVSRESHVSRFPYWLINVYLLILSFGSTWRSHDWLYYSPVNDSEIFERVLVRYTDHIARTLRQQISWDF